MRGWENPVTPAVLVLALLASGCLTAAPESVESASAAPEADLNRAAELATLERLWGGETERVLLDADVATEGPSLSDGFYWMGRATFNPGASLVLPGTERLDVLVTASEPTSTRMRLTYRPAYGSRTLDAGVVPFGTPVAIPLEPSRTDDPRAPESAWRFVLTGDVTPSHGKLHVTVTAHRLADLAQWPPLPTFYANGSWVSLLNEDVDTAPFFLGQDDTNYKDVPPTHIVPPGTRTVLVNVTLTSFEQSGEPTPVDGVQLRYLTGASTRYTYAEVVDGPDANNTWRFRIEVTDADTDSPYAEKSEWRFEVRPDWSDHAAGNRLPCSGCLPSDWAYHIEAAATLLEPREVEDHLKVP